MTTVDPICEIFSLRMDRGLSLSAESTLHLSHSYYTKKYEVFRNVKGVAIGYIIWAEVSEETYYRLFDYGCFPIYSYEWDEGCICLVLDVVFGKHGAYEAKRQFVDFARRFDFVAFKKGGSVKIYKKYKNNFVNISRIVRGCHEARIT